MIKEELLTQIINDQKQTFVSKDIGVLRDIDFNKLLKSNRIIVITGIRRSGKSTLLRQIANRTGNFYYVNFDDERLWGFELNDFQTLMLYFHKTGKANTILIDEIQNVPGWERFIRRIHDENFKIFLTGSNAKLLSSELSTHLTGRYKKVELYPFSFSEYTDFLHLDTDSITTQKQAEILNAFDSYLKDGGFPEYLKYKDTEDLQNNYNDIIYKDLIVRFSIKNHKAFKNLSSYLMSNFTKEISYNSLKSLTGITNTNTIKDYIDYLQQAYLLFECYKFDYSLKKQTIYSKKIYAIDNGLRNSIAFNIGDELGQSLENLIYIELKRRFKDVFFFKTINNHEVDFIIYEKPIQLIQVSYSVESKKTYEREIRSLIAAMNRFNTDNSLLITYNTEKRITIDDKTINIIPAWKYLLHSTSIPTR